MDVHSVKHEVSLTGEVVKSIPTVRSYNALLVLVPGVVTNVNDTVTGTATTSFPIHGGRTNEGRLSLDGLTVGSPPNGNSATSYVVDAGNAAEVTFTTAGALGETETAGLVMNIVPRNGSNTMHGSFFVSGTGANLQSDNLTPALREQGVTAGTPLTKVYDVWGAIGGPIMKDRVWYFANAHIGGSTTKSPNVYYNLNAGDPNSWLYAPDLDRLAYSDRTFENASGRVTWQVTPRHRVSGFWDAQALCRTCTGATAGLADPARVSPEAVGVLGRRLDVSQATWSWPITNRLAPGRGFWRHCLWLRQLRAGSEPHARSDPRRGAVREGLRREREHSRAGLPIAGLQHCSHWLVPLEGLTRVRDRLAQPEDRISAHADDGRPDVDDEQSEPHATGSTTACRISSPNRFHRG